MVHRRRSPMANSRVYRRIPNRENLIARDRLDKDVGPIPDCPRVQLTASEQNQVMELNMTGQTWLLPVPECREINFIPTTKHILQDESNQRWEVRNAVLTDDQLFWRCLCILRTTDD